MRGLEKLIACTRVRAFMGSRCVEWMCFKRDRASFQGGGNHASSGAVSPGTRKGPTAQHRRPVPLHVGEPPRHQTMALQAWERG